MYHSSIKPGDKSRDGLHRRDLALQSSNGDAQIVMDSDMQTGLSPAPHAVLFPEEGGPGGRLGLGRL